MLRKTPRPNRLKRLKAEINVVPYIDVMLVLLVIFMITAPLLTQGINVNLPYATGKKIPHKRKSIIVSVNQRGQYFLNTSTTPHQPINAQTLLSDISAQLHNNKTKQQPSVSVKGDKNVNYGKVITAMSLLQKAGAKDIGLFTQTNPSAH
jgi:biopolymer transport protein TolR